MDASKPLNVTREIAESNTDPAKGLKSLKTNHLTAMMIIGLAIWVIIYDSYAAFFLPEYSTVSHVVQAWCIRFPVLSALIGFVMGHLLWPVTWPKNCG